MSGLSPEARAEIVRQLDRDKGPEDSFIFSDAYACDYTNAREMCPGVKI